MNLLLVSLNRCREPVPVLPLGACVAAEAAEAGGHRVRLLDLTFQRDPLGRLRRELREGPFDAVGLSVRNLDNAEWDAPVSYVPDVVAAAAEARAAGLPVLLGGAAVGVMPEALLQRTGADAAVAGDGEAAILEALRAVASGDLSGRSPEQRVFRQRHAGRWSLPKLERWLDLPGYARRFATVPLQTKRGCPFGCVYCTYPAIEGCDYRLCPPGEVGEEVRRLGRLGVQDVEFVDNLFNAPRDHALEICGELARKPPGVRLHSVDLSPLFLDAELLRAMTAAGFAGAGVTAESASDRVLERLGKGFGADAVHRAADAVRRARLPTLWIFLLGGPGETEATARETLRFAAERLGPTDAAFFSVGVRVYPGTGVEALAKQQGLLEASADLLEPTFYVSPELDPQRLLYLVRRAVAGNPRFIGPGLGMRWALPAVRRLGYALGLRPPLWRHTGRLRRFATIPRGIPE